MDSVRPLANQQFIEIGPGRGAMTAYLLQSGAKVCAIEIDPMLVAQLRDQFCDQLMLDLHHADALDFDYSVLLNASIVPRVVANLPYNIGIALLTRMLAWRPPALDMHLMLQREVAKRLYAPVNSVHYGRLSVLAQNMCQKVKRVLEVRSGAFTPAPEVRSEVVYLLTRDELPNRREQWALEEVTRCAFGMRRKQIKQSLGKLIGEQSLTALGIDVRQRPQEIDPMCYLNLARCYMKLVPPSDCTIEKA